MARLTSRALSLAVAAAVLLHILRISPRSWYVTLIIVPALVLIWFPDEIDELTFGVWTRGYQIDTHTPGPMIAAVGWILLIVEAVVLYRVSAAQLLTPRWAS